MPITSLDERADTAQAPPDSEYVTTAIGIQALRSECVYIDHAYRSNRTLGIGWYRLNDTFLCVVCGVRAVHGSIYCYVRSDSERPVCYLCVNSRAVFSANDEDGNEVWELAANVHIHSDRRRYTYPEDPEVAARRRVERLANVYSYSTDILSVLGRYAYVGAERVDLDADDRREILLGVELEVDRRENHNIEGICRRVMQRTDYGTYGFVKQDGTCTGGEYVTLPCDLDAHRTVLQWDRYCEVLQPLARGFHGSNNGMHIHINRRALTPTVLGRMLIFLNEPMNEPFLTMIAQRKMGPDADWCKMIKKTMADGYRNSRDRYQILNVSDHTAEVRMFKSTLLPERIVKNLEFAEAIVTWCRKGGRLQFLTPGSFVDYVCSHKARYPELEKFIRARWIPGHPASAAIEE